VPSRYWYHFSGIISVAMQDVPFPPVPTSAPVSAPADCGLQSHVILVSCSKVDVSNHTGLF